MSCLTNAIRCESHPKASLIEDYRAGDLICPECGLVVVDRVIDVCSEWRTFSDDTVSKDMCRVGALENPLMEGRDLSTTIGQSTGSAGFGEDGKPLYRNRNSESAQDKTMRIATRDINEMSERLTVDRSIASKAQYIFHKVHSDKLIKGRSNDAIISACMYIACRQESVPRTFKEICAVSNSSKRLIGRYYKAIEKLLPLANISPVDHNDFYARFCSKLSLPICVEKLAKHISKRANQMNLINARHPVTVAATSIYMAAISYDIKKSTKEISLISGAAESTIRIAYKSLQTKTQELISSD